MNVQITIFDSHGDVTHKSDERVDPFSNIMFNNDRMDICNPGNHKRFSLNKGDTLRLIPSLGGEGTTVHSKEEPEMGAQAPPNVKQIAKEILQYVLTSRRDDAFEVEIDWNEDYIKLNLSHDDTKLLAKELVTLSSLLIEELDNIIP